MEFPMQSNSKDCSFHNVINLLQLHFTVKRNRFTDRSTFLIYLNLSNRKSKCDFKSNKLFTFNKRIDIDNLHLNKKKRPSDCQMYMHCQFK